MMRSRDICRRLSAVTKDVSVQDSLPGARVIVHGARKCDVDGEADGFWVVFDGDLIAATGTGAGWAEHAGAPEHGKRAEVVDAAGALLTPGFIDLHGHGGGGRSFDEAASGGVTSGAAGSDWAVDGAFGPALAVHRAHGTTRSVISLVANPVAATERSLAAIADLAERDPLVLGSHLEGPFLAPGRRGAHNPAFLIHPSSSLNERLVAAARGTLRQITIAPELPGGLAAVDAFTEAGAVVAVGHTRSRHGPRSTGAPGCSPTRSTPCRGSGTGSQGPWWRPSGTSG
jgi:N-acetylglucosamine-6-phosphate deacetylase